MVDLDLYIQQQKGYLTDIFLTMVETEDFDTFVMCYRLLTKSKIQKDYPTIAYLKLIFDGEPYQSQNGFCGRKAEKYNRTLMAFEKEKKGIQLNNSERYFLRKYGEWITEN